MSIKNLTESIIYKETRDIPRNAIVELYHANHWSSAAKPELLCNALMNSATLISAWEGDRLVGLGNAITDGYLVVYYPHLLVLPDYQGHGIGREIVRRLSDKYAGFHQQILVADGGAIRFYEKCGFERAGETVSMWIYQGSEH